MISGEGFVAKCVSCLTKHSKKAGLLYVCVLSTISLSNFIISCSKMLVFLTVHWCNKSAVHPDSITTVNIPGTCK